MPAVGRGGLLSPPPNVQLPRIGDRGAEEWMTSSSAENPLPFEAESLEV